jgi:hypothetical protein
MPAPPDKQRRRLGQPAPSRPLHRIRPSIPAVPDSRLVAESPDARVVDLEERRTRRLSEPWPGWWGDAELRTWSWAERSRGCRAC